MSSTSVGFEFSSILTNIQAQLDVHETTKANSENPVLVHVWGSGKHPKIVQKIQTYFGNLLSQNIIEQVRVWE